ncbi:MAG: family 43 glycosylhydrolase [Prevotella sp.]
MKKLFFSFLLLINSFVGSAAEIQLADPTIYYDEGVYYLTGTLMGNGFRMYQSTDLVHWTLCGNASEGLALHKNDVFGDKWFWAPQIFKYDGVYYMAYTANELIAIAKSDSPIGPFKMDKKVELPHDTRQIDPYVFIDDDGKIYLYYVRFSGGNTLYVSELTDDFSSFKPNTLKKCFGAELPWEKRKATVTEGPAMFKDGGYYYLIYSANDYESPDYAVGYAYSTSPTGPWTKLDHPFLSRHSIGINGTGHGDMFRDEQGQWYYVFHVHASNSQVQTRRTAIVPITVTDDPENKFILQVDRFFILTDDAPAGAGMPEAKTFINAGRINYSLSQGANRYMQVECKDVMNFGGYEGELVIPDTIEYDGTGYPVKRIGKGAFYNCRKLQKVTLPNGIIQIGTGAFESSGIRSVSLPETVTQLGYQAFKDCTNQP